MVPDSLTEAAPVADPRIPTGPVPSGTEAALASGSEVGEEFESAIPPDERDDLEGPDVLSEDDGTLTHPSFGAGVPLNLGMGTGAGSDEGAV